MGVAAGAGDLLGAPVPRTVPPWLARLAAGEWGVAFLTALVGASNARARKELAWEPAHPSRRDGLTAVPARLRSPP